MSCPVHTLVLEVALMCWWLYMGLWLLVEREAAGCVVYHCFLLPVFLLHYAMLVSLNMYRGVELRNLRRAMQFMARLSGLDNDVMLCDFQAYLAKLE